MSYLEENREVLERRFPGLWETVFEKARNPVGWEEPEFILSRGGAWSAKWRGRSLASSYDPVREAERSLPDIDDEVDFAVAAGLGLGYSVELLVSRYPDLPVLIAEPEPYWMRRVLEIRDLRDLLANPFVSFLIGGPSKHIGSYLSRFACRKAAFLPLRPVWELFPEWMSGLEAALSDFQAKARVNDLTLRRFYTLWLRNRRKNWAQMPHLRPVEALKGIGKGKRAVLVAAGPSLGLRLRWLKRFRDRFVLIAVDTAWNALKRAGIVPDFLVFMDGQYWNSRHVDGPLDPQTVVIAELASHPHALRLAEGRTYICASSVPFFRDDERKTWGELGSLKSGGSVATTAWELATHLGFEEVAFVGLDLGYPSKQTHVKGSQFEEKCHFVSTRLVPAETRGMRLLYDVPLTKRQAVGGGWVYSDPRMDLYRDWFELSFRDHPEVKVFNLSPVGSLVRGMSSPNDDFGHNWSGQPPIDLPSVHSLKAKPLPLKHGATFIQETLSDLSMALDKRDVPVQTLVKKLERAQAHAEDFWGQETWQILGGQAYETWKLFPGRRSLQALHRSWLLASEIVAFWNKVEKSDK